MTSHVSIQSNAPVVPVQKLDLVNPLQRLSSRQRINAQENASQEHRAQKVNIQNPFASLSEVAAVFEAYSPSSTGQQGEFALELRDLADKWNTVMERIQNDTQLVYIAKDGLQKAFHVLKQMSETIQEAVDSAVYQGHPLTEQVSGRLQTLFDTLKEVTDSVQFQGRSLFQDEGLSVRVGEQEVSLELPPLELAELPENDSIDMEQLQKQIEENQDNLEGEIARLGAFMERLKVNL